jgi:F0F1-type ATP synthase epsilon subunit
VAKPTNFRCIILSPKNLIYESEIYSLFLEGDRGEFELLAYHYPLVGNVAKCDLVIDETKRIAIKSGIVRFYANECTVLVEETPETMMMAREIIKKETAKV